jgi:hypothetical protein
MLRATRCAPQRGRVRKRFGPSPTAFAQRFTPESVTICRTPPQIFAKIATGAKGLTIVVDANEPLVSIEFAKIAAAQTVKTKVEDLAFPLVMPALVAGIHVLLNSSTKDVDGQDKPGHDEAWTTLPDRVTRPVPRETRW